MNAWRWVDRQFVIAAHEAQLAEHGGATGVRDITLLESALGKPENQAAYGQPDVADLAASYGYGISRNHPFIDGNKRTAFVVSVLFIRLNGYHFQADEAQCVLTMLQVAAGEISEAQFAVWLRQHTAAR